VVFTSFFQKKNCILDFHCKLLFQPFFVLHKAQSQATLGEVSRSGKGRKRGVKSSPKSAEKFKWTASDEQSSQILYEQWRLKAFNETWSKIQASIEVCFINI
jgi:hypothetical protein